MSNPFESYGSQRTGGSARPSLRQAVKERPLDPPGQVPANPFEAMANRQLNGAHRGRIEREEAQIERQRAIMMPTPLEKRRAEKAELMRQYRAWRRECQDEIIRQHGHDFAALLRLIRNLSWPNAHLVVDFVLKADWMRAMDQDMRLRTLDFIESSFCRARVREGLSMMDDGLWDEPLTPFLKIRRSLFGY